jgi:phosphotransacetylase
MITGHDAALQPVAEAGPNDHRRRAGHHARSASTSFVARHQTVLIADTAVTERPDAEQLASIALRSAGFRAPHGA